MSNTLSATSSASTSEPITIANAPALASAYLQSLPPYPDVYSGRGIVISAGGIVYLTCAWVLINMLRRLGCTLPIEVWYRGEDERDLNWIKLVEPLGVRCVDAYKVREQHPHQRLNGWEMKAFAMLHCPFEEVLLFDADNVPVVDPTFLFDTPEYRKTGAIFWPDISRTAPDREQWRVFDVPFRDEWEQESGQILIDKRRSWRALCLCDWYNQQSAFYYRYVYGDKDTFRFAWHRTGQPYAMPEPLTYRHYTIPQADFRGNLIFQHRHWEKWSLLGNSRLDHFLFEDECFAFVRELRLLWNPLEHAFRHLTDDDWQEMAQWAAHEYRYSLVGRRRWPIRLSPDGYVHGHGPRERYWWFHADRLVFTRLDGSPPVILELKADGTWRGNTDQYGGAEICLIKTRRLISSPSQREVVLEQPSLATT